MSFTPSTRQSVFHKHLTSVKSLGDRSNDNDNTHSSSFSSSSSLLIVRKLSYNNALFFFITCPGRDKLGQVFECRRSLPNGSSIQVKSIIDSFDARSEAYKAWLVENKTIRKALTTLPYLENVLVSLSVEPDMLFFDRDPLQQE